MARNTSILNSASAVPRAAPAPGTIGFISLGCAKNLVDSEIMAARLMSAGWRLARAPEQAAIVIVNTCAFVRDAKVESLDAVFEACSWKKSGCCRAVIVAGCLPQRYRGELAKAIPEADAFIGLDAVGAIERVAARLARGERGIDAVAHPARAVIEPPAGRPVFTGAPYAYLKIAEGCNHGCRFCAIPGIRGRSRSRTIGNILAEAESLLASGARELNLIAQDVTAYGRDLGGGNTLPNLLRALGALGGRFWIRLLYGHPAGVSDELLDVMGATPQACRYLDIPIQHSHPAVLKAMGRPALPGGLPRLLRRIRGRLPGVVLRTTCLVGFPGETEEQFRHLLASVEDARFERLAAFAYSREEGTAAYDLPRQVPLRRALRRKDRLMRLQQRVAFKLAAERVGRQVEILIEKPRGRKHDNASRSGAKSRGNWIGRSRAEAPEVDGAVFLEARGPDARPGAMVQARLIAADGYDMLAARSMPGKSGLTD